MGKAAVMSAVAGNARIRFGHGGMSPGLKCGEIRGQSVKYLKKKWFLRGVTVPSYSCTWHVGLNGKTCYGAAVVSAAARGRA